MDPDELYFSGWEAGAPSPQTYEIDAGVARGATCPDCGRQGLEYHPFTKAGTRAGCGLVRYRAFLECPDCGRKDEL